MLRKKEDVTRAESCTYEGALDYSLTQLAKTRIVTLFYFFNYSCSHECITLVRFC